MMLLIMLVSFRVLQPCHTVAQEFTKIVIALTHLCRYFLPRTHQICISITMLKSFSMYNNLVDSSLFFKRKEKKSILKVLFVAIPLPPCWDPLKAPDPSFGNRCSSRGGEQGKPLWSRWRWVLRGESLGHRGVWRWARWRSGVGKSEPPHPTLCLPRQTLTFG